MIAIFFVLCLFHSLSAMESDLTISVLGASAFKSVLEQLGTIKHMLEDCGNADEISLPENINSHAFNNLYALMGTTVRSDEKERNTIFSKTIAALPDEELTEVITVAHGIEASEIETKVISHWINRVTKESVMKKWMNDKKYNLVEPKSFAEQVLELKLTEMVNGFFPQPNTIQHASVKQLLLMKYVLEHKKSGFRKLPCPDHEIKKPLYRAALDNIHSSFKSHFVINFFNNCFKEYSSFGDSGG